MRAWVGLGANLGDPGAALDAALVALAALPATRLLRRSSRWRSAPVDAAGPDFVNAVAEIDTALEPLALLDALHAIEAAHGRERPYRNAPRTLDLDLIQYGDPRTDRDIVCDTPRLTLPCSDSVWPRRKATMQWPAGCVSDVRCPAKARNDAAP